MTGVKTPSIHNVSDKTFWSRPAAERAETWTALRRDEPMSWQAPSQLGLAASGDGYWAVTRHADIQEVSRDAELYCSSKGVGLANVPPEMLELNASFLVMDDPRHAALRRVVSGAFTPARSRNWKTTSRRRQSASSMNSWRRAAETSSQTLR